MNALRTREGFSGRLAMGFFMIPDLIYQWNPFNIFGNEVTLEDLICNPLRIGETLMEDEGGRLRRIRIPSAHASTLQQTLLFRLQIFLNQKGHLPAIDKILSCFYQKIAAAPPRTTQELQAFLDQVRALHSLRNDNGFGSPDGDECKALKSRLQEAEAYLYSIFAYYFKIQLLEKENLRKMTHRLIQRKIEKQFQEIVLENFFGLVLAQLFLMVPDHILRFLIKERVQNLLGRFVKIQNLIAQIDSYERMFESPCFSSQNIKSLQLIKRKLFFEASKIGAEAKILLRKSLAI